MPKQSWKSNKKQNKKKKLLNSNASFPHSTTQKYNLQNNDKFAGKMKSSMQSKKQRKQYESFIKRQNNASLPAHVRIQELLKSKRKNKNKNKNKKKKKKKKKWNDNDLDGAQFRWMNEMLYNTTGQDAKNKMKHYKQEFIAYHKAYNDIVQNEWPQSPLQKIIKSITKKLTKLKHKENNEFILADFGCGDAKIAKYFDKNYNKNKNICIRVQVKSFDLFALNDYVTECDISNVPLKTRSVDMVIFCLSLMGTDFHQYLIESYRVLKTNGLLKIAEVRSRFYSMNKFEKFLNRTGFDVVAKDLDNTYFVVFHCQKSTQKSCQKFPINFDAKTILKPCAYKKR